MIADFCTDGRQFSKHRKGANSDPSLSSCATFLCLPKCIRNTQCLFMSAGCIDHTTSNLENREQNEILKFIRRKMYECQQGPLQWPCNCSTSGIVLKNHLFHIFKRPFNMKAQHLCFATNSTFTGNENLSFTIHAEKYARFLPGLGTRTSNLVAKKRIIMSVA